MKTPVMLLGCLLSMSCILPYFAYGQDPESILPPTPLDMPTLKVALSFVRGGISTDQGWPRVIQYSSKRYDYTADTFLQDEHIFRLEKQPTRIIPHAVGIAEILWAICPRERIIAVNEFAANPKFSFIADEIKEHAQIFTEQQTELVIGYQPDLVLTAFYSGAEFKAKLSQAQIPFFDMGYFGTIESIKHQIVLIGEIVGEEGNAQALVDMIDLKRLELQDKIPKTTPPKRILFYDTGGYVPGQASNFTSLCEMIGVVNVAAEQGINTWAQIDYETVLSWDPDIIVVSQEYGVKQQLMASSLLAHAKAVKEGRIYAIPDIYLYSVSQYMLLGANALAGVVHQKESE